MEKSRLGTAVEQVKASDVWNTIVIVLIMLWLLSLIPSCAGDDLIHVLPVIAIIMVVARLIRGCQLA